MCKDPFYGKYCQEKCAGIRHCDGPHEIDCTCIPVSLTQKVQLLGTSKELVIGLVCLAVLLFALAFLVFQYDFKFRQLKNELASYSQNYACDEVKSDSKSAFNNPTYSNPIYSDKLPEDLRTVPLARTSEQTKSFLEALKSNSLFNRMSANISSDDWLKLEAGQLVNVEKPVKEETEEIEADEHIYSSIKDLQEPKNDTNDLTDVKDLNDVNDLNEVSDVSDCEIKKSVYFWVDFNAE